jgi:SNF2 family DNA or RNA helicase
MKKAVKFLLEHGCAALLLDPGMSKTAITLAAVKMLKQRKLVSKVLVVCTVRAAHSVWPKEMRKWTDFCGLSVEVLHGPKKDAALKRDADVYVVNYEGLEWLLKPTKTRSPTTNKVSIAVDVRRFKALGFDLLVLDELHKVKNTGSGRFKMLKAVHHTFARRWGLTGSPTGNGLMDLFGQAYILDQGRSLGPYVTHFRNRYFRTVDKDGFVWELLPGADEQIYERVAPLALRMAADDYLDMPQLVFNDIKLDLPPDVRKIYDRLEEDLIAQVEDHTVTAANAAVASGKLRQVANGGLYLDRELLPSGLKLPKSKREWVDLHTVKVDALADLIEELQGEPLLVAYDFQHDLTRLQERLGQEVPYIGGGVSMKRSKELELAWNAGRLPVLLGHPQAMAESLNLQEAGHHVCWHSMTYDYTLYDQFIRRVLRQGNTSKRVFCHHLLMRDTVDTYAILPSIKSKTRGQGTFFKALQELAKGRRARR